MNVSLRSAGKVPGVKRKGYLNVEARVPAGAKAGPAHEGGYFEWNHLCSGEREKSEESREKCQIPIFIGMCFPLFLGKATAIVFARLRLCGIQEVASIASI